MMFRLILLAALSQFAITAAAETLDLSSAPLFAVLTEKNQALVGYLDSEKTIANYALCDVQEGDFINCQKLTENGFKADNDDFAALRFQFSHNLEMAYHLVQVTNSPEVQKRFANVGIVQEFKIAMAVAGGDKSVVDAASDEVGAYLISSDILLRPTAPMSAELSAKLISLVPNDLEWPTMEQLSSADDLDLGVVASTLKLSFQQLINPSQIP